jgi:hypothetical protein
MMTTAEATTLGSECEPDEAQFYPFKGLDDARFPFEDEFAMVLRRMEVVLFSTGADVLSEPEHVDRLMVGEDPGAWKMFAAGEVFRGGSAFWVDEESDAEILCDLARCMGRVAEHLADNEAGWRYAVLVSAARG